MGVFDKIGDFFSTPDQSFLNDPERNPAGRASELTSLLTRALASRTREPLGAGVDSALDLLSQRGRTGTREEDFARRQAEGTRQQLRQDISQQAAQAGLTGAAGTAALAGQAEAAGQARKRQVAQDAAFQRETRRKQDLGLVLQDLFQNTALDLAASRTPAQRDTRPTGLKNLLGLAGEGLNAYVTLQSGGLI